MEQQGESQPGEVQQQQPQATPTADASQIAMTHHSNKASMEQQGEPQPGEVQQQPQATPTADASQIAMTHDSSKASMEQQGEPQPGEQQQPQATPTADASQIAVTHHSSKASMEQQGEPQPGELQQQQPLATPTADSSQIARPNECGVCLFVYNELDRRPRCLPCGHTYCSLCVSVLLQNSHIVCPSCRTDHCAPEPNHFPICYALEAMMKVKVEANSQSTGEAPKDSQATEGKTKRRGTTGLSRKLRSMVQEQKESIKSLETTLKKELMQLNQYRAKLVVSQEDHSNMLKELDKIVQQHLTNIRLLHEEDEMVEGFVEEGEEVQRELSTAQGQLDKISTAQEAFTTIDAADHTVAEVEEWLQHSREEIPTGNVLRTSFVLMEITKQALKVITRDARVAPYQARSGHMKCTVMEAVRSIEGGSVELKDVSKEWCEAGRVFLTHIHTDGSCFSSKVSWKEYKMYLNTMKPVSPPSMSFTLQVNKVLRSLKYLGTTVFLDLSWFASPSQRIYIRLADDTPLTRQFVTLCLGHTGLTYCSTSLLSVENLDSKKIVWGGDITNQKAATKQPLPQINEIQCGKKVAIHKGMVVAKTDLSDVAKRTWFGIVMGSSHSSRNANPLVYQLGYVNSDGLDVLEKLIKNDGGSFVRVVNCGVVY